MFGMLYNLYSDLYGVLTVEIRCVPSWLSFTENTFISGRSGLLFSNFVMSLTLTGKFIPLNLSHFRNLSNLSILLHSFEQDEDNEE